ncbi:MAG: D-glycero-beta-D-manno-heptose-7-phosphate kinase [Patescibacteria group bacterium]|nr:D-glycero-beta-D-manno-heptose-7-phosphate kinase [Patescibacteria group bacterium]
MKEILEQFSGKTILVIGDIMIDHYLYGSVSRQSPEAPVPVLLAKKDEYRLGGAANVSNNILKLGGKVALVSMVGEDSNGEKLRQMLEAEGLNTDYLVTSSAYPTTEKLRVIDDHNKQLIRLDFEKTDDVHGVLEDELIAKFDEALKTADGVLISDYAKGVMSPRVTKYVIERCGQKLCFIDPKPTHKDSYKGAFLITPNEKEAAEMAGVPSVTDENCNEVGNKLKNELDSSIVMTRGSKGMRIFHTDGGVFDIPTHAQTVFDVTGAGDTVVAAIALALSSGANIVNTCKIANAAAQKVIEKFGTEVVSTEEILSILSKNNE